MRKHLSVKNTIILLIAAIILMVAIKSITNHYRFSDKSVTLKFKDGTVVQCKGIEFNTWGNPIYFKNCNDGNIYQYDDSRIQSFEYKK